MPKKIEKERVVRRVNEILAAESPSCILYYVVNGGVVRSHLCETEEDKLAEDKFGHLREWLKLLDGHGPEIESLSVIDSDNEKDFYCLDLQSFELSDISHITYILSGAEIDSGDVKTEEAYAAIFYVGEGSDFLCILRRIPQIHEVRPGRLFDRATKRYSYLEPERPPLDDKIDLLWINDSTPMVLVNADYMNSLTEFNSLMHENALTAINSIVMPHIVLNEDKVKICNEALRDKKTVYKLHKFNEYSDKYSQINHDALQDAVSQLCPDFVAPKDGDIMVSSSVDMIKLISVFDNPLLHAVKTATVIIDNPEIITTKDVRSKKYSDVTPDEIAG